MIFVAPDISVDDATFSPSPLTAFFNIFLASFCILSDSSISVTTTSSPSTILVTTDAGVGPRFSTVIFSLDSTFVESLLSSSLSSSFSSFFCSRSFNNPFSSPPKALEFSANPLFSFTISSLALFNSPT